MRILALVLIVVSHDAYCGEPIAVGRRALLVGAGATVLTSVAPKLSLKSPRWLSRPSDYPIGHNIFDAYVEGGEVGELNYRRISQMMTNGTSELTTDSLVIDEHLLIKRWKSLAVTSASSPSEPLSFISRLVRSNTFRSLTNLLLRNKLISPSEIFTEINRTEGFASDDCDLLLKSQVDQLLIVEDSQT